MENNGTAILVNVKAPNGGDLILVVDHQAKKCPLSRWINRVACMLGKFKITVNRVSRNEVNENILLSYKKSHTPQNIQL